MPEGGCYDRDGATRFRDFFPITYEDILIDPRVFPGLIYLGWHIPGHKMNELESGRITSDSFIDQPLKFICIHYQVPGEEQERVNMVNVTTKQPVADSLAVVVGSNIVIGCLSGALLPINGASLGLAVIEPKYIHSTDAKCVTP
ncbi:hypothetical protein BD779DRAFT_1803922 [Infundibulicybe gibba]|nr:hypothetical protein BD779DRAFT_1803922 [Infundibulicybe gibba]